MTSSPGSSSASMGKKMIGLPPGTTETCCGPTGMPRVREMCPALWSRTRPSPPVPVVLDNFSQISSPQCSQSSQCTVGPWTCCWDPDAFGDAGGQQTPLTYAATFAAPLNLSAMQSLQMWLGFGSRYYAYLEYHGKIHGVQVFVTLTDDDGVTLGMSRSNLKLPVSPVAQQPVFSRVTMRIPQNAPVFDYGHVASYSVEIINRHDRIRRLSWVTAYLDALTAYPGAVTVQPVTPTSRPRSGRRHERPDALPETGT